VPNRLSHRLALFLAGLLIALPSESIAQRHGGRPHDGGGHGGGGHGYQRGYGGYGGGYVGRYGYSSNPVYYGYRGYGGYRPYPGYAGYPGYYGYGGYYGHDNDAWIAIGAGILGFVLGSVVSQRQAPPYGYSGEGPPPAAPATHQCPDGSTIPVGVYCQAPPPPAPQPPLGERG
jgi:hypothetical protein